MAARSAAAAGDLGVARAAAVEAGLGGGLDDRGRRREVRVADREQDHVLARRPGARAPRRGCPRPRPRHRPAVDPRSASVPRCSLSRARWHIPLPKCFWSRACRSSSAADRPRPCIASTSPRRPVPVTDGRVVLDTVRRRRDAAITAGFGGRAGRGRRGHHDRGSHGGLDHALSLPEVRLIVPDRFGDDRGFFSETYSRRALAAAGIVDEFVQDNHSLSARPGTVRGLHYQAAAVRPGQAGAGDARRDLRRGGRPPARLADLRPPTSCTLSAEAWNQLFVPVGLRARLLHAGARHRGRLQGDARTTAASTTAASGGTTRRWASPWPVEPRRRSCRTRTGHCPVMAEVAEGGGGAGGGETARGW